MSAICEVPGGNIAVAETPMLRWVLAYADDALILGHRLSEWCSRAPSMEEDMALANLGLDLLGQARFLYSHAATLENAAQPALERSEDDYAYRRDAPQFRNALLVEQPNGDFAATMVRHMLYASFADLYWRASLAVSDPAIAAFAARSEKEIAYHERHAADWVIRLGDGTAESRRRAQSALDGLLAFADELFETEADQLPLMAAGAIIDPARLRDAYRHRIEQICARATLSLAWPRWHQSGGRQGRHGEHLGHLLAELQFLPRAYPGASW
ncbi:MAG TPA: phenylacetate-CoA oxygenase subunit PaaC [Acidiphilium sp.]|nr:MAG: phenylacetate-CoA oxygenase subunit PaaI [Acidiphilium sp. 21-60-14]OYV91229.1 MAG: phenylacetate-CoA oxygenase subunit PaaI [Acidiphilium sp. 37-60-79]HQT87123.1 phenylacetate-CoA oxygenase subunit PaaC [Acidiphilium sp.]HQU24489.1 phenylacetate-CoA oxygenase subunit PaaC [Acidiphilium sp.]